MALPGSFYSSSCIDCHDHCIDRTRLPSSQSGIKSCQLPTSALRSNTERASASDNVSIFNSASTPRALSLSMNNLFSTSHSLGMSSFSVDVSPLSAAGKQRRRRPSFNLFRVCIATPALCEAPVAESTTLQRCSTSLASCAAPVAENVCLANTLSQM